MSTPEGSAGYVRLFRKLLENPIWKQLAPAVLKVAIYFLLRANYRSLQWYDGSETVEIPAGSFITSYARTVADCNLSAQQVRDAFAHLFGTGFATYRRTPRWTLVTVLNWETYQASADIAEHTGEHALDQAKNRQGTLSKELRIKNTTPPSPSDEGECGQALLDIEPATGSNGTAKAERSNRSKNGTKAPDPTIARVARAIHDRHPEVRKDSCSVALVEKLLAGILKYRHVPRAEKDAYLERINQNHASQCASEKWQKDGGQYANGLENWLAPTKLRYEQGARAAACSASNYMPAEDDE